MPEKLRLAFISKTEYIYFEEKAINVYYSDTAPAGKKIIICICVFIKTYNILPKIVLITCYRGIMLFISWLGHKNILSWQSSRCTTEYKNVLCNTSTLTFPYLNVNAH